MTGTTAIWPEISRFWGTLRRLKEAPGVVYTRSVELLRTSVGS